MSVEATAVHSGEREQLMREHAEQLRAFQGHAGGFIVGMTVIFGVNLATNLAAGIAGSWSAWWSLWALIGWSAGVAIHGLVVWLNRPLLPAGKAVWGDA
jgi:hypothetical protein